MRRRAIRWPFVLAFLIGCGLVESCWGVQGPILTHDDPSIQREFKNVYDSINSVAGGNYSSSSMTLQGIKADSMTVNSQLNFAGSQAYVLLYSSTVFIYFSSCTTASLNTNFVPTNTAITITPKRTTSRIEVNASATLKTPTGATTDVYATIYRGSSNLAAPMDSFCSAGANLAAIQNFPCSMGPIFDLPNTTSATTYTVEMHNDGAASVCWNNNFAVGPAVAIITVKEWGY